MMEEISRRTILRAGADGAVAAVATSAATRQTPLLGPLPGRTRVQQGTAEGWIRAGSGARLRPGQ